MSEVVLRTGSLSLRNPSRPRLFAFVIYLDISICFFGLGVLANPSARYIGFPHDPSQVIWFLAWWPHALLHGLNPLMTRAVWAPVGFNLTWSLCIPAISVLAAPVTLIFGPLVAYNLVTLLAPAVSAWTAYLLCRRITGAFWPSSLGGYLYGFSSYELVHVLAGHLSLSLTPIPPLCAYMLLVLVRGEIGWRKFVPGFGLLLILQFLTSPEVFATMTMFGAMGIVFAALLMETQIKVRIYRIVPPLLASYVLAATIVSPYLYLFLFNSISREPIYPVALFSSHLTGFIIPGPLTYISRAQRVIPPYWENGEYLGLPLILLVVCFALRHRRKMAARFLVITLGTVCLASLGPKLPAMGELLASSPVSSHLPLLDLALPARFVLYAWLALALIASMWLSTGDVSFRTRIVLGALSVVFLLPNPTFLRRANTDVDTPPFISAHLYRRYLRPQQNVLIVPYGHNGDSMLWQAQTGMYFRMAGGWLGLAPPEFLRWPIVTTFYTSIPLPDYGAQLKPFLARYQVDAVIIKSNSAQLWSGVFSTLDATPINTGGVTLYLVAPRILEQHREASLGELERQAASVWFSDLLMAGRAYLARDLSLTDLTPLRARQLGLLPAATWPADFDSALAFRRIGGPTLWLGPWQDNTIAVGLSASYAAVAPLIARYRPDAAEIYFPYPNEPGEIATYGSTPEPLLMIFNSKGLSSATKQSSDLPTRYRRACAPALLPLRRRSADAG